MSRRRIRSLKPEFFEDEKVGAISRDARLVTIGLITLADDRGRLHYKPLAILGDIFPEEAVAMRQMKKWLAEIVGVGLALVYKVAANEYLWLPQFLRHQVVNKPTESILPPHPDDTLAEMPITEAFKAAKCGSDPVSLPDNSRSSPVDLPTHARSVPFPSVPTSFQGEQRLTREIVDEAITILGAQFPDATEQALVGPTGAHPNADLIQGCHLAVSWAAGPDWQMKGCSASLVSALGHLESKARIEEKTATGRSDAGQRMRDLEAMKGAA